MSKQPTSKTTTEPTAYIVLYDFPKGASLSTFYRRLGDLLNDQGGTAFCQSTKSAYIVRGDGAKELAYAIGKLAERYGAGKVGEPNGTIVQALAGTPDDHFAQLKRAEHAIDDICVDRRFKKNKQAHRGIGNPLPKHGDKVIDLQEYLAMESAGSRNARNDAKAAKASRR